jgi:shikimate dehydrogenase
MITGKTFVTGIFGDPVEHVLSPIMHNSAFKHLKLDYVYVPFQVSSENLEKAIEGAKATNIKGLNVTIPHKTEVIQFLDELDRDAELIGAVNTIKFTKHGSKGYNTDGIGAIKALEEIISIKNKKAIVLGAGGAARAICYKLVLSGVNELIIANRTIQNGAILANEINENLNFHPRSISLEELKSELISSDILVNTTPVGMYPKINEKPIVNSNMMHSDLVVNDIIYNPLKTKLLKEAENAGARTLNGVKMLVYQGAESFKIWTDKNPPVELMFQSFMDNLQTP